MKNRRLFLILTVAGTLLLLPFAAMQFSEQVRWTEFDFLVAGILLMGAGTVIELVLRKVQQRRHRLLLCLGVLAALVVIWTELAVGIFGSPLTGS